MNCPYCGEDTPDGSGFCQFCGRRIAPAAAEPHRAPEPPERPVRPAAYSPIPPDPPPKKKKPRREGGGSSVPGLMGLLLGLALLVSLGFNIFQGINAGDMRSEIQKLEDDREAQEAELAALQDRAARAEKSLGKYESAIRRLSYQNIGYSSQHFYTDVDLLVCRKYDGSAFLTLSTLWPQHAATVYIRSFHPEVATVEYTEDHWYDRTAIEVTPHSKGLAVLEFDCDLGESFRVLVIVI